MHVGVEEQEEDRRSCCNGLQWARFVPTLYCVCSPTAQPTSPHASRMTARSRASDDLGSGFRGMRGFVILGFSLGSPSHFLFFILFLCTTTVFFFQQELPGKEDELILKQ